MQQLYGYSDINSHTRKEKHIVLGIENLGEGHIHINNFRYVISAVACGVNMDLFFYLILD